MASGVVYEGIMRRDQDGDEDVPASNHATRKLFTGYKLWFSHGVPARSRFMEDAKTNGAEIVPLEKQAHVRLVDHAKRNQAPGTHSYRWVELSLRNAALEDLDAHRIGAPQRVDRPVGSVVTGPKGSRNAYTEEEDQFLYNIMKLFEDAGAPIKGNEIYKQIERLRPRHTFQSWRDHYLKHVQGSNRTITDERNLEELIAAAAPADTRPDQQAAPAAPPTSPRKRQKLSGAGAAATSTQTVQPTPVSLAARNRMRSHTRPTASAPQEPGIVVEPQSRSPNVREPVNSARETPERQLSEDSPGLSTSASQRNKPLAPDHQRVPSAMPDISSFGSFSRRHADQMYDCTLEIINCPPSIIAEGFDKIATEKPEFKCNGHQLRKFWQFNVLPDWLEDEGKSLDDINQELLLPAYEQFSDSPRLRTVDPEDGSVHRIESDPVHEKYSGAGDEVGQATANKTEHENAIGGDAEEPDDDFEEVHCSHCGEKESRKWRLSKRGEVLCDGCWTILKETRMSGVSEVSGRSKDLRAKRHSSSPELPPRLSNRLESDEDALETVQHPAPNESRKRSTGRTGQSTSQESKKSSAAVDSSQDIEGIAEESMRVIEIPSTPEHAFDAEGTTTSPGPSRPPFRELRLHRRESSPLFVPADNGDAPQLPTASSANRTPPSSPLHVRLANVRAMTAISTRSDKENDDPSSESQYVFETAPDLSQDWDTAPEVQRPVGHDEPPLDFVEGREEELVEEEAEHDSVEEEQADDVDIDTWFDHERSVHAGVKGLDHILVTAIQATCMKFSLASEIVKHMVDFGNTNQGRRLRREGRVPPPNDVAGCWTDEDDNLLHSDSTEDQRLMLLKHGRANCEERFDFLEKYNQA